MNTLHTVKHSRTEHLEIIMINVTEGKKHVFGLSTDRLLSPICPDTVRKRNMCD